jgi:hypothetical protein
VDGCAGIALPRPATCAACIPNGTGPRALTRSAGVGGRGRRVGGTVGGWSRSVGYPGLMPGTVIASSRGMASETAVVGLGVLAFSGFGLALATARADDRLRPADR